MFDRLGQRARVTDEVVPILTRAQTTVDGVNLELARVDEIMETAVHATKGAEKTVQTVSSAVTAPVRRLTGFAAGAREAVATLRARRAADAADWAAAPPPRAAGPARRGLGAPPPAEAAAPHAPPPRPQAEARPARHQSPY